LIRPHGVRGARDHATEVAHACRSGASENEGDIAGAAIYLASPALGRHTPRKRIGVKVSRSWIGSDVCVGVHGDFV
jgi:hypothetical protein